MTTEAQTIADLAELAFIERSKEIGELYAERPYRARGGVQTRTGAAFVAAVGQRRTDLLDGAEPGACVLYGDPVNHSLVCVLNDDYADQPGWRDHRVMFAPRRTPEWDHWTRNQGLKKQDEFAEIIEDGLTEISNPDPATMTKIATQFQASVSSKVRRGASLADGARQLLFDENVEASAGSDGTVSIPAEFEINVAPWVGAPRYAVKAHLRFRINQGELSIGYKLIRPHLVEDDAFAAVVEHVQGEVDLIAIEGAAPEPALTLR